MSRPSATPPPFLAEHETGVVLRLRVQPAAGRNAVVGLQARADGEVALKVQVSSPPEGGKANAAVFKLLSKAWRVPKSHLSLLSGETARDKLMLIEGDSQDLQERLALWWKEVG